MGGGVVNSEAVRGWTAHGCWIAEIFGRCCCCCTSCLSSPTTGVVVHKGFCNATKGEEWSIEVVDAIGWERAGAEGSIVELVASFATGLINRSEGQPQQAAVCLRWAVGGGLPKILTAASTDWSGP